jgi:hypothetical protein
MASKRKETKLPKPVMAWMLYGGETLVWPTAYLTRGIALSNRNSPSLSAIRVRIMPVRGGKRG